MSLTANAQAFKDANAASPVIAGAALHRGPARPENVRGIRYTLEDGKRFTLNCDEVESLPVPRWKGIN